MEIRSRSRLRLLLALLLGLLLASGMAACQADRPLTPVPAPGYAVLPQFHSFYADSGGAELLGEAITGACEAPDGRIVQYFRRVRLDDLPDRDEVMVYPLGEWALDGVQTPAPAPVPAGSEERYFPETGYAVQDEFLSFFDDQEGENVLGLPISPQLYEGELRVQYFRNGRLEWHPESPRSLRVRLGPLGQAHYMQVGSAEMRCDVLARPATANVQSAVEVQATMKAPILYAGEEQVVYVQITTPAGRPVSGIPVFLSVTYRGDTFARALGETGEAGAVAGPLNLPGFVPGEEVEVEVLAYGVANQILGQSGLSFKTWW